MHTHFLWGLKARCSGTQQLPWDPAEAISLAHAETLSLKKINSIFTSVMKIYGDFFNSMLKLLRYNFFMHPHTSANNVLPVLL